MKIKKRRYIQLALALVTLLIIAGSLLVNSPRVQQRVSVLLATELENRIGTRVNLGGVHWLFPNDIVIDSLAIDDQEGEQLLPYRLSSGEKQMLVILLTVLVQDKQPCVLLMDEPEVSLHIEWQQRIISIIREMNPNAQIILTTHSPAVVMGGWMDAVTEVTDITV